MKRLLALMSLAALCLVSTEALSQTNFTGAISQDWGEEGNWTNGLPASGNNAIVNTLVEVFVEDSIHMDFEITNYDTIVNFGTVVFVDLIVNEGTILNYGTMWNDGFIGNEGSIENVGVIENDDFIANFGTIINGGFINNEGGIDNQFGTIINDGIIDDNGTITNPNNLVYGCMDTLACNYNPEATAELGLCQYPNPCGDCWPFNIPCGGCTDFYACNFNEGFSFDDGSCIYDTDDCGVCGGDNSSCSGCTHENATNYDLTAIIEDGSCLYTQDAYDAGYDAGYEAGSASVESPPCANADCPGDFTADGYIGVDDILSMLSVFDTSCSE